MLQLIGDVELESDQACAVYDPNTGRIEHVHHVITLKGGTKPDRSVIEARAIEFATQREKDFAAENARRVPRETSSRNSAQSRSKEGLNYFKGAQATAQIDAFIPSAEEGVGPRFSIWITTNQRRSKSFRARQDRQSHPVRAIESCPCSIAALSSIACSPEKNGVASFDIRFSTSSAALIEKLTHFPQYLVEFRCRHL